MHKTLASNPPMGRDEIRQFVKQCPICQRFKKKKKKYIKLPPKSLEQISWDTTSLGYCNNSRTLPLNLLLQHQESLSQ